MARELVTVGVRRQEATARMSLEARAKLDDPQLQQLPEADNLAGAVEELTQDYTANRKPDYLNVIAQLWEKAAEIATHNSASRFRVIELLEKARGNYHSALLLAGQSGALGSKRAAELEERRDLVTSRITCIAPRDYQLLPLSDYVDAPASKEPVLAGR